MTPASSCRAALLGLALTVAACDVAQFAMDPKPRFTETWNLPGPSTHMSVAKLLPTNGTVSILPDSSAFSLQIDPVNITAGLGANCGPCSLLNGTNAPKPAFTMSPGNSTNLPSDIVGAAILSGQINLSLTNGLSFDPLYVNTGGGSPPQGTMVIVVRSGSVVLGRDSVRGAAVVSPAGPNPSNAPFAPGTTLNRTIVLNSGTIAGSLTIDFIVDSPLGDHLVPINVGGTFSATVSVPFINVASVSMNVPSRTFDSGTADSVEFPATGDYIVGLGLAMGITNPFPTIGAGLNLVFAWGPNPSDKISKPIALPSGCSTAPCTGTVNVSLDSAEVQQLLTGGDKVSIGITGNVSSTGPLTVTPKMEVGVTNRITLKIRTPNGEK
jgi:hypothetical protein